MRRWKSTARITRSIKKTIRNLNLGRIKNKEKINKKHYVIVNMKMNITNYTLKNIKIIQTSMYNLKKIKHSSIKSFAFLFLYSVKNKIKQKLDILISPKRNKKRKVYWSEKYIWTRWRVYSLPYWKWEMGPDNWK